MEDRTHGTKDVKHDHQTFTESCFVKVAPRIVSNEADQQQEKKKEAGIE